MSFKINKVYTRSGDDGQTGLVGGTRVSKDSLRIEAYGTVDELNAIIGMLRCCLTQADNKNLQTELDAKLQQVQQDLFNLGSELACPPEALQEGMPLIDQVAIKKLETMMDVWNQSLEELTSFILPCGGPVSSWSHIARTVCRRAERVVVNLGHIEQLRAEPVQYLNRLSDMLFVLGRWVTKETGETEHYWEK